MASISFMFDLIIRLYNKHYIRKLQVEGDEREVYKKKHGSKRRSFLKKAMWSAPVLTAMGQMLKPSSLHAESHIPDPFGFTSTQNSENGVNSKTIFDKQPLDTSK